ncbi:nitrilase-related carbon-nitrogen hydrolase [Haloferula sp. BvORR071]|uniref:nitrilase-related carbon-nitrogen hydrolase n=1 Tax=Haloferula sp. BvORR071 TaxID=1396141 RepID=UPI00054D0EEC|nr:nitrilase-related carbon-nitrogen hydrolase [Haloferula sp. BvORR071]
MAAAADLLAEEVTDAIEVRRGGSWQEWTLEIVLSVGLFQAGLSFPQLSGWLVLLSLVFLLRLRRAATMRRAFYGGLLVGLGIVAPQLTFFFHVFGSLAFALWFALAVWVAAFVALGKAVEQRFGREWGVVAAPVLWLGLEFTRCEVWPLKFTWLTPGFVLPAANYAGAFHWLGVYGIGALMVYGAAWVADSSRGPIKWVLPALLPLGLMGLPHAKLSGDNGKSIVVAGVQREDTYPQQVIEDLNEALRQVPEAKLYVLSEYSYQDAPPPELLEWCRQNARHVLVGGVEHHRDKHVEEHFYNMAYIIGPDGKLVHKQAKSVPIQFMSDGEPAQVQSVWDGPLGRIGVAICYDMNYARVMDGLIGGEAALLVIPAMDVISWGERAHRLSAQLAAVRAAEYGVPLFRLASSGYSRIALPNGKLMQETSVPGQGEVIHGRIYLPEKGRRPLDRWLAWPCVVATLGLMVFLLVEKARKMDRAKQKAA